MDSNTRKKRICIFSAQYLPSLGGVERYTDNLANTLQRNGNEVTIVTSNIHNLKNREKINDINIYRIPSFNAMHGRYPILKINKETRMLINKIKTEKYDLVITNTRFYLLSILGTSIGKKAARNIVIEHGTSHMAVHNKVLDILEQIIEHAITFLVKRNTKEFYGVSLACNEWLKHFNINASGVIYNSIDLQIVKKIEKNEKNIREKLNVPPDALLISFTGRLLKEKGIYQLIDAFAAIKKENTYLVLAGDGPELQKIKEKNTKHLILLGRIGFEEVIELLTGTDIFCMPSDSEGMPTSVLEAIACHNFVITTERGGAKEIIIDNSYGMILKDNSVEKVQQAIEIAVSNDAYRKSATEKAYQKLEKEFTWNQTCKKVEKLMEFL